jgi:hypothetical protein
MSKILEDELKTYEEHKQELLKNKENEGKYVLIKGTQIIGIFDLEKDAMSSAIKQFGDELFLVKRIEEIEQVQNYTSTLIMVD